MTTSHGPGAVFVALLLALSAGCANDNSNTTVTINVPPPPIQKLRVTTEPERITALKKERGEQEFAAPVIKILAPADGAEVVGPTVPVRLALTGELHGYQLQHDPATGAGNHIHVILDDNPYEPCYSIDQPFELKNVAPGQHVLRVFAARLWHESYKNDGSFQMITFRVKDASPNTATPAAFKVDPRAPLLTYSRPRGEYAGSEANPIMLDFWLSNARLRGDGGEYRVRYIIDDDEPRYIDEWGPNSAIWLDGWLTGKHTVRLELLGADQYPLKNGSFNITTHEITVIETPR
jgi:hypothetical protein